MDVGIPITSMSLMLICTAYVTMQSIQIINHTAPPSTVNVKIMYIFAAINLVVDVFVTWLFRSRGDAIFYHDHHHHHHHEATGADHHNHEIESHDSSEITDKTPFVASTSASAYGSVPARASSTSVATNLAKQHPSAHNAHYHNYSFITLRGSFSSDLPSILTPEGRVMSSFLHLHEHAEEGANADEQSALQRNLNMVSAFFHIGGDTLRTVSIFIAAIISSLTKFPSELCDAWAAVVVSATIIFLAVPMSVEIYNHAKKYLNPPPPPSAASRRKAAALRPLPRPVKKQFPLAGAEVSGASSNGGGSTFALAATNDGRSSASTFMTNQSSSIRPGGVSAVAMGGSVEGGAGGVIRVVQSHVGSRVDDTFPDHDDEGVEYV
jgi:Co/Zn/Cd efflux system component